MKFDLERFKNGEIAVDSCDGEWKFAALVDGAFGLRVKSVFSEVYSMVNTSRCQQYWTMKDPALSDGWIKHDGGECPIPWAKGSEVEVKARNGIVDNLQQCKMASDTTMWVHEGTESDAVAYRLADGWILCDGKTMPSEIEGSAQVEVKLRNGYLGTSIYFRSLIWTHNNTNEDIVAVRVIKKSETAEKLKDDVMDELPKPLKEMVFKYCETDQQRLTRIASTAYFEKHFAKVEPMKPLGQSGIEGAIFDALCKVM